VEQPQRTKVGGAPITRRRVLQGVGALALAAPFASALTSRALAQSPGASPNLTPSGSLLMAFQGDASAFATFNDILAAFNRDYPNIDISFEPISTADWATYASTVLTQLAGGKEYDLVEVAIDGQLIFSSKGVVDPLDDLIARDQAEVDAYYAAIDPHLAEWSKTYGSQDGKTYFIPGTYNGMYMYANKDVFQQAGVDLPAADWTWDDFKAAGTQMKERVGAFITTLWTGSPFIDILPWLNTNGASTLAADWKTPTFDSPAAIEAATFVKSLLDEGLAPEIGGTFDANSQFAKGKLATLVGGRWPVFSLRDLDMVDKTRVLNWPTKTQNGSPVGWDAFPIVKGSKNRELAWIFNKWTMTKEANEAFAVSYGAIPPLNDVANGPVFLSDAPEGTTLLSKVLTYGTPVPSPAPAAAVQDAVTSGWRDAITGLKPVDQALHEANEALKQILA
jgi:multiple sugar transport system substrate-binding protein